MRLNAYLARAGLSSRRGADRLIEEGRVRVNDRPAQLNDDISATDVVQLDGKRVEAYQLRYILLNKPAGYLTTMQDPHGRRKVTDLIKVPERVVPVGRLDYDTTGVLILTNDGELANQLMHPSFEVDKVYVATVQEKVTGKMLNMLSIGVKLDGQMTAAAKARKLSGKEVELTIHEGRKHQVKRMLAAAGLTVTNLQRSQYGPLTVDGLKAGQWRDLTPAEINRLKMVK